MSNDERRAVARQAARAGGMVAADGYRGGLAVETKDYKTDTVTAADRNAQKRVAEVIAEHYPDEPLVGEEIGARSELPASETAWIVDPIDGTNNFVREFPVWGTAVGCMVDGDRRAAALSLPMLEDEFVAGRPTAGPTTRNGDAIGVSNVDDLEASHVGILLWWAMDDRDEYAAVCQGCVERFADIRRIGSAQATLANVAAGTLEGAVTTVTGPAWDTVAGVHLIEQAGGTATDIHGDPWTPTAEGLVVSNGEIHEDLLAVADAAR